MTGRPSDAVSEDDVVAWVRNAARAAASKTDASTVVLDVGEVLSITSWFVVTSGNNPRQVRTIAEEVERVVAEEGGPKPRRIEGLDSLQWVLMDYGDFVVTYETGVDDQLRYDTYIEVYGASGTMKVQYDTPYVRHFPTTLQLELTEGDSYSRSVRRPHLKDPYTYEIEYFHDVVVGGGTPKTTPEDYVADMALFVDIIRAIQRGS